MNLNSSATFSFTQLLKRGAVLIALPFASFATHAAEENTCDMARGQQVFNKCRACHTTQAGVNMMGPSLAGIYGSTAGAVKGFRYSPAMQQSGLIWDESTLHGFLASPMTYLPGNAMPFGGIKDASERAALICFMQNPK